jgi:hypothetical protein
MVLSNGSKSARLQNSIINRTNVCGGVKKSGTAPRIGFFLSNNPKLIGAQQSVPKTCVKSTTIQTQNYGYRATIGGV